MCTVRDSCRAAIRIDQRLTEVGRKTRQTRKHEANASGSVPSQLPSHLVVPASSEVTDVPSNASTLCNDGKAAMNGGR